MISHALYDYVLLLYQHTDACGTSELNQSKQTLTSVSLPYIDVENMPSSHLRSSLMFPDNPPIHL